jgi:hypothetical protein
MCVHGPRQLYNARVSLCARTPGHNAFVREAKHIASYYRKHEYDSGRQPAQARNRTHVRARRQNQGLGKTCDLRMTEMLTLFGVAACRFAACGSDLHRCMCMGPQPCLLHAFVDYRTCCTFVVYWSNTALDADGIQLFTFWKHAKTSGGGGDGSARNLSRAEGRATWHMTPCWNTYARSIQPVHQMVVHAITQQKCLHHP